MVNQANAKAFFEDEDEAADLKTTKVVVGPKATTTMTEREWILIFDINIQVAVDVDMAKDGMINPMLNVSHVINSVIILVNADTKIMIRGLIMFNKMRKRTMLF